MDPSSKENYTAWTASRAGVILDNKPSPPTRAPLADHNGQSPDDGSGGSEGLQSLDISSSQFMNAINFESLQNGGGLDESYTESVGDLSQHEISVHDHSQLIERFNQLRQWQLQQQQSLMRQQQIQLDQLHGEQQRVQAMLAKQKREVQWGSPKANKGMIPEWSSPRRVSPSKRLSPSKPESTVPRAIASGTLAQARVSGLLDKPQIRAMPQRQEYKDMLSDTESEIHSLELEEGIQPLPDTASEMSDYVPNVQGGFGIRNDANFQGGFRGNEPQRTNRVAQNEQVINIRAETGDKPYNKGSKHTVNGYSDVQKASLVDQGNIAGGDNIKTKGGRDLKQSNRVREDVRETIPSPANIGEGDYAQTGKTSTSLDDRPVGGVTKTFEELLEIQLQKELVQASQKEVPKSKKQAFLRRGQGTARYGMSQTPPRKPKISKTHTPKQPSPKPPARKVASMSPDHHPLALKLSPYKGSVLKQTKLGTVHLSDTSFQNNLQDREKNEKFEKEELEEFELLEKYADASFMSNPSPLVKANWRAQMGVPRKDQAATVMTVHDNTADQHSNASSDGSDSSSDSGDSSQGEELDNTLLEQHDSPANVNIINNSPIDDASAMLTGNSEQPMSRKIASPEKSNTRITTSPEKPVPRKVASIAARHVSRPNGQSEENVDDISDDDNDDYGDDDKDVYGDADGVINDNRMFNGHMSVISEKDEENEESDAESGPDVASNNKPFEFNDEESWDNHPTPGKHTKTIESEAPSLTPPTSKLMTKLFPKLKKPKETQAPPPVLQQNLEKLETASQQPISSEGVQSKALRDKLMELETEIDKFRTENAALNNLRKEREKGLEKLKKEIEEFEKQKDDELKRIQEFKTQEMKKIKHERKIFDQYQKAAKAIPDKKGREEIEALQNQVSDLQEELKRKESRWTASSGRLRDRIEQLETENMELKNEAKILEKKRLELWQKNEEAKKASKAAAFKSNRSKTSEELINQRHVTGSKLPKHTDLPVKDNVSLNDSTLKDSRKSPAQEKIAEIRNDSMNINNNNSKTGDLIQPVQRTKSPLVTKHASPIEILPYEKTLLKEDDSLRVSLGLENSPKVTSEHLPEVTVVSEDAAPKPTVSRKLASIVSNVRLKIDKGDLDFTEETYPDGKIEKIFTNGAREVVFPNGTRKEISADAQSIIVSFFNGDIKQVMPDQRVVYYYAETQTTHTRYPDGLEILQFPNGQTEKTYTDGTKEISFPDHTIKYLYVNGLEESIYQDGTVIRVEKNGDKTMEFPNGQREIHTAQYKRREYPDGTVKTVYPDGKQETHYSNGRVRIKDKLGHVLVDKINK